MKLQETSVCLVHTIHKHLFFVRQNAGEVGALQTAFPFGCIPCASMREVLITLPLEFVPTVVTCLSVWGEISKRLLKHIYII